MMNIFMMSQLPSRGTYIILPFPSTPSSSHWPYIPLLTFGSLFPHSRSPTLATLYVLSLRVFQPRHSFSSGTISRFSQTLCRPLWECFSSSDTLSPLEHSYAFSDFMPSLWERFRQWFSSGTLSRFSHTLPTIMMHTLLTLLIGASIQCKTCFCA